MDISNSILRDVRKAVGLSEDDNNFDTDLLQHINSAIIKLNQNGVGNSITINDNTTTWEIFRNPEQIEGNKVFALAPLFITLSTKLLFDPPPPSNVQYYNNNIQELLWRLKIAYEIGELEGGDNNE